MSTITAHPKPTHPVMCFTKSGILNPETIDEITRRNLRSTLFFADGSEDAFQHIKEFDTSKLGSRLFSLGLMHTPIAEMRVRIPDGSPSIPTFVINSEDKAKTLVTKVCSPLLDLAISDITSSTQTWSHLRRKEKEAVCYLSYMLWGRLLVAEERLAFPAAAMDAMVRWNRSFLPQSIDLELVRKETGLSSLQYHAPTDTLSIDVAGDLFTVRLSVLDQFYKEYIQPLMSDMFGSDIRLRVVKTDIDGQRSEPTMLSYGQLGKLVDDMSRYIDTRLITSDSPIHSQDLKTYAYKAKVSPDVCQWVNCKANWAEAVDYAKPILVPSTVIPQPIAPILVH